MHMMISTPASAQAIASFIAGSNFNELATFSFRLEQTQDGQFGHIAILSLFEGPRHLYHIGQKMTASSAALQAAQRLRLRLRGPAKPPRP